MIDDADDAKGIVVLSMAMPDAESAIRAFVNNSPELPHSFGSEPHEAFLAGKDATVAVCLAAFRADNRGGALTGLSAETMLAIGNVVLAVDRALSEKAGVDTTGLPLPPNR